MNPNNQNNMIAGALTYPTRSNNDPQTVAEQPRQPRNLRGLLRFAMEATKAEDAPGNSQLGPMDEERRKFLEEVMRSLTVNVAQIILDALKVLTNTERIRGIKVGEELPRDVRKSFDDILEYVDDIDTANDFYKMGGFAIFPICYGSENDEVRALASTILGSLSQNNPFCQEKVMECGLLNILLTLLQSEQGEALVKCLFAISCICREYEPACTALIAQEGCTTLAGLLGANEPAARAKAAFLIRYFAAHYNMAREQFIHENVVKTIAEQLRKGRDGSSEHLLNVITVLLEDSEPTVLKQCRDPTLGLQELLQKHLEYPELESFIEEKEYCEEILEKVFEGYEPMDNVREEADR